MYENIQIVVEWLEPLVGQPGRFCYVRRVLAVVPVPPELNQDQGRITWYSVPNAHPPVIFEEWEKSSDPCAGCEIYMKQLCGHDPDTCGRGKN